MTVYFVYQKHVAGIFIFDFPKAGAKSQVFYNLLNKEEIERKADMQVEELRTEKDENVLVTVGRLEPIKGQMLIPEVAKMLEEDGYQFRWYLIGDGSMYGELEHRINELGVSDKVILLGSKDNPYPYIKGCDVYVQTSLNEGFGLTVAEAKILYKPIVTTDAGVMSEQILNGETGVIIEKAEPELLFENIKTMLDCPEVRACYIQNLQRVEYDTAKEMQKLYEFIED